LGGIFRGLNWFVRIAELPATVSMACSFRVPANSVGPLPLVLVFNSFTLL
jgi:hypothetical protein